VPALWKAHATRGPDDRGYLALRGREVHVGRDWVEADAAADLLLVHNRLTILDLTEGGWQPMSSHDGRYHLVFNGEIYNYLELRETLEELGHVFKSTSDTEVLLAAFVEWNREALQRLVGMFAFAILDLDRRSLFLARDFFGMKPLMYANASAGFVFGSSMRSVLEASGMDRVADPMSTYRFMRFGATDEGEDTLIQGVKHLPPAHYLEVSIDEVEPTPPVRYWELVAEPSPDVSFPEAAQLLRDAFMKSVDLHLRSDVPVGAALSGGIDSSAVVMAMRELQGDNLDLHTFSFISENLDKSEEKWVDIVGSASGAHVHKVRPVAADLIADLEKLIDSHGEPFGSTNVYASRRVFQLAREWDVPVMLDGQGADEMLAGYPSYLGMGLASLIRQKRLLGAAKFLRHASNRWGLPMTEIVAHSGRALLPGRLQRIGRSMVGRELVPDWMDKPWAQRYGVAAREGSARIPGLPLKTSLVDSVNQSLLHLLRYEDRNSMAFSVESRLPFLTPELAGLVLSFPESYLLSEVGESKSVFRAAMRGIVPDEILDRRDKIAFAAPEQEWLLELSPWVKRVLSSPTAKEVPILDLDRLRIHADELLGGRRPFGWELWRALNLIEWARLYDVSFE